MLTKSEAELIRRARETLEALWDCEALECRDGAQCERCSTLAQLDALLEKRR